MKGSACGGVLESVWRALCSGWFLAGNIILEYGKVLGGIQGVGDSSGTENIQGMCGKLSVGWRVNIVSEYEDGWGAFMECMVGPGEQSQGVCRKFCVGEQ